MSRTMKRIWGSRLVALVLALCLLASTASLAFAGDGPRVIPSDKKPGGLTYGEWNAKWWQWALSLPTTNHPLFDETGADCGVGQRGQVWFLGGVFNVSGTAVRDECVVPHGKMLLIPILNIECSTLEGDGKTRAKLRACADFHADSFTDLALEVDGKSILHLKEFRSPSPAFHYGPLPEENILGADPGATSLAVADGIYVMLAPLDSGKHTIHFHGRAPTFDNFTLDITYHLRVVDDD
jgi:hypothetical protein